MTSTENRRRDRQVLALAAPALATLLAEPLFLVADTAIVGQLGTTSLAGLGLGATIMGTVIGLAIFLAYGTTATTARHLGAGRDRAALTAGVDGLWLALGLGSVVALGLAVGADELVGALGGSGAVAQEATAYLRASLPGLPFMLISLAATGVLRGLLDTRTPLVTTVVGAGLNVVLNWALVHPAGLGIAGSGLGTSISQLIMGAALAWVVVRHARRAGASLQVRPAGLGVAARAGAPLVVRSAAMRVTHLVTTVLVTDQGPVQLAAHQVVLTVWTFTAFALDAIAIAGQALVGRALGSGDVGELRALVRRMVQWGVVFGVALGVLLAILTPWLPHLFSEDVAVHDAATTALWVATTGLPVAGLVFVLDGVLIGAGDGRYLGLAAVVNTLTHLPLALAAWWWAPSGTPTLAWLWVALAWGWMVSRAVVLGRRILHTDLATPRTGV